LELIIEEYSVVGSFLFLGGLYMNFLMKFKRWKSQGYKSEPQICEYCEKKQKCIKYKIVNFFSIGCFFRADCYKKKPEKYVEKDTVCDVCEFKSECNLTEITGMADTRRHFVRGIGSECKRNV